MQLAFKHIQRHKGSDMDHPNSSDPSTACFRRECAQKINIPAPSSGQICTHLNSGLVIHA